MDSDGNGPGVLDLSGIEQAAVLKRPKAPSSVLPCAKCVGAAIQMGIIFASLCQVLLVPAPSDDAGSTMDAESRETFSYLRIDADFR